MTSTDHALFELNTILSHDIFHAFLGLQPGCHVESLRDDRVGAKVSHGSFKQWVFLTDIDHIVYQACRLGAF